MNWEFEGYPRPDGGFGIRNYVAVIPSVVCANEVARAVTAQTSGTRGLFHQQGCSQLLPDLQWVTRSLIGLGTNPNVGAALIVSLGCEGTDTDRVAQEIAASGRPVEVVRIQDGDSPQAIAQGIRMAQKLVMEVSQTRRERTGLSHCVVGLKCGGSDATSGVASNCAIGYAVDKLVDAGATVVFGETTELIGAEQVLVRRAATPETAEKLLRAVEEMENRGKSMGVDMRKGQPTPGNIEGGLSTIEEKSLGAILKSGSRPIRGVIQYPDRVTGPGLWFKDSPGRETELLTGMAAAGAQAVLFSTGRGAPQGFPTVPVIKVCGNSDTGRRMASDMDIDAGGIIDGRSSIAQVGEEIFRCLLEVLSGRTTRSESIRYDQTINIYTRGPII